MNKKVTFKVINVSERTGTIQLVELDDKAETRVPVAMLDEPYFTIKVVYVENGEYIISDWAMGSFCVGVGANVNLIEPSESDMEVINNYTKEAHDYLLSFPHD